MKWTVERSPKDQPWLDAVRMMDRSDAILRSNEEENQLAYLAKKAFPFLLPSKTTFEVSHDVFS